MVALVAACAVLFTWATIATAVAVAQAQLRATAELQALGWKTVWEEEKDRAQAFSLSEFRAHRPVAMPLPSGDDPGEFFYDPTGLISAPAE